MKTMYTVVLLTDFGNSPYPGIMKGVIKKINNELSIIDLSHNISPQNIIEASFILANSYRFFPKNSIFVCVIDPTVGSKRKIILLKTNDYYFLAPDNGLLSLIKDELKTERIIEVTNKDYFLSDISETFQGRDIFAPVSAHLPSIKNIELLGRKIDSISELDLPKPSLSDNQLSGKILFIDSFGNIITNISKDTFSGDPSKKYSIRIGNCHVKSSFRNSYSEVNNNDFILLYSSFGYLELSQRNGNAAKTLEIYTGNDFLIDL